jgi:hypothetical protein
VGIFARSIPRRLMRRSMFFFCSYGKPPVLDPFQDWYRGRLPGPRFTFADEAQVDRRQANEHDQQDDPRHHGLSQPTALVRSRSTLG